MVGSKERSVDTAETLSIALEQEAPGRRVDEKDFLIRGIDSLYWKPSKAGMTFARVESFFQPSLLIKDMHTFSYEIRYQEIAGAVYIEMGHLSYNNILTERNGLDLNEVL